MRVLIVDPHAIYRHGMAACLRASDTVTGVTEADNVAEAWASGKAGECELAIVDEDVPGALEFVRQLGSSTAADVIVCATACNPGGAITAVESGAKGYLQKHDLTDSRLCAAVQAAVSGTSVIEPDLLGVLVKGVMRGSRQLLSQQELALGKLDAREREVLRMVADGHPIREVAEELRYSERTIKNVIRDVVIKLNVRSRSQAVAEAVREGLI